MRIAQITPRWEKLPPPAYGDTKLVVNSLTEELLKQGHDVTLFTVCVTHDDSISQPKLGSLYSQSPQLENLGKSTQDYSIYDMLNVNHVYARADEFDVIHSHVGRVSIPYSALVKTPTVHTLHGIFNTNSEQVFSQVRDQFFVSISDSQRDDKLGLNYMATVYNGINPDNYKFHLQPDHPPYLAFLGRIAPDKGAHLAIEIAKKSGWGLRMAGTIAPVDMEYFEQQIQPHIDGFQIKFLGEASHREKCMLMGGAVATLCPITWQEPFGLVMIESMVTGTPVIAIGLGSAPEIIVHDRTGFLCQNVDECVAAIPLAAMLDRQACRDRVLVNFTAKRMAEQYEALYQKILAQHCSQNGYVKTLTLSQ